MRIRKAVAAAIPVLTLALVASSCSTSVKKAAPPAAPDHVERVRLNGDGDFGFPQPFTARAGRGANRVSMLFDSLLWKDASGDFLPWLAEDWQRSADGLEWRFTLRDGVAWHDGQPLTADDVVFTFQYRQEGPGNALPLPFKLKEVKADGANGVVFRLDQPYATFEEQIGHRTPILPKHIWSTVTEPAKFTEPAAAIGTGPYTLGGYDAATGSYLYVANESFFLGTPYVRRVEYVNAPNELLALRRGEIDVAKMGIGEEPVVEESLADFIAPAYAQVTAPGAWNRVLHFNLTKGFPYDNKSFRQAVAYAIDRNDLVKRVLLGNGEAGTMGALGPTNPWVAPGLPAFDPDLAKAKALLDSIGMRDTDGDGFRDLPDGSGFKPEILTNSRHSPKAVELVKEYLRAVGINTSILSLDTTAADNAGRDGNYVMAIVGYANGVDGDPDWLRQRLSTAVKTKAFTRVYGWSNPAFEEAATKQLVAVDPAERRRWSDQMQRAIADDVPMISLYLPTRRVISATAVFSAWYFTPAGIFGSLGEPDNKHVLVTGKQTGLPAQFAS